MICPHCKRAMTLTSAKIHKDCDFITFYWACECDLEMITDTFGPVQVKFTKDVRCFQVGNEWRVVTPDWCNMPGKYEPLDYERAISICHICVAGDFDEFEQAISNVKEIE